MEEGGQAFFSASLLRGEETSPATPVHPSASVAFRVRVLSNGGTMKGRIACCCGLVTALLATLRQFPPDRFPFWPPCVFHQLTGLQCPGCGGTRAVAALLHGHLREALHFNALLIVLLPVLCRYGAVASLGRPLRAPRPVPMAAMLLLVAGFTVWRNLP